VIHADSAADTRAFGARLGQALSRLPLDGAVAVTLSGDLGAGKTTLVAGLLEALGHRGPVRSPTYTLIEPYRLADRDIYHCDLYRLRHPQELDDLGLRELRAPGSVLLVEWPERAEGRLGATDLILHLTYQDSGRSIEAVPTSDLGQALARQLSGLT
jgi:tRNA threonylcarbamoyladenosine biosynthesis protein TsaE